MRINRITIENFQGARARPAAAHASGADRRPQLPGQVEHRRGRAAGVPGVARARRPEKGVRHAGQRRREAGRRGDRTGGWTCVVRAAQGHRRRSGHHPEQRCPALRPGAGALRAGRCKRTPQRPVHTDGREDQTRGHRQPPAGARLRRRAGDANQAHPAHRLRAGCGIRQAASDAGEGRMARGHGRNLRREEGRGLGRRRADVRTCRAGARQRGAGGAGCPRGSDRAVAGPDHAAGGGLRRSARPHRRAPGQGCPPARAAAQIGVRPGGTRQAAAHVESLEARAGTGPRVGLVHDLARCLDDAYNIEDISFKLPAELDGRILKAFVAYEAQYGSLDAAGGDRKHPPPCRRRSKPATSWPAASGTTAATLPPQKKPPKNRPATPRPR